MNGCIKYFENGGKNISFLFKNSEVWEKYEDIWDVIIKWQVLNFIVNLFMKINI